MRWRKLLIGLAVCAAIVAIVVALIPREPKYEGRTLSEWIKEANPRHSANYRQRKDFEAVRHIGTNGLPWLVKWIGIKDPPWWRLRLIAASQKLPQWMQTKLTQPILGDGSNEKYRQMALDGFFILGPQAGPATVELLQIVRGSSYSHTPWAATRCLTVIEALDHIGKAAVSPALGALTNRANSITLRFDAATWLFHIRGIAGNDTVIKEPVLSFMAQCIRENRADIAPTAAHILANFSAEPALVVPLLIKNLQDPDPAMRELAATELRRYGPNATAAVPALVNALNDPNMRELAENALFDIDKNALEKAEPGTRETIWKRRMQQAAGGRNDSAP
jgi:HEAT repeats